MNYMINLLIVSLSCALAGVFFISASAVSPPVQPGIQNLQPDLEPLVPPVAVEDEVIVKFKAGVPAASIQAAHTKFQAVPKFAIPRVNAQVVKLPAKKSPEELRSIVEQYKKDPTVAYAELNAILTIQKIPEPSELSLGSPAPTPCPTVPPSTGTPCRVSNDARSGELWGIRKIRADCVWDLVMPAAGDTIVAVVDTGVDYTHEDLSGKVLLGYDFMNNDADPRDDNGHGTHVAGTIAATINNNKGVVGIAPNVRILAVKVLGASGSGTSAQVASGIVYAADQGAKVINVSLGSRAPSQTIKDAVGYAWSKGVMLACAAGNTAALPFIPFYPASFPGCLPVAATDHTDQLAWFSQYAPEGVAAPGVQILSTLPGNQYNAFSGTSMATPHVAGLAALLFSQNPNRTNSRVRDMIQSGTDDMGSPGKDPIFGFGRINVDKAVKLCGTGPNLSC